MFFKSVKKDLSDPGYWYIVIAAVMTCLFMTLSPYVKKAYEYGFVIPCMLWLGVQQGRGRLSENRKNFILPGIMVAWFLLLQIKRGAEEVEVRNIGLFITVYLFAFPLASVLREQDGKRTLKLFAGAYVTAAAVLAADGLMLILNCLPEFLAEHVVWDGARLRAVWHPNVVGCYLMIGIIFCTVFFDAGKIRMGKNRLGSGTCHNDRGDGRDKLQNGDNTDRRILWFGALLYAAPAWQKMVYPRGTCRAYCDCGILFG